MSFVGAPYTNDIFISYSHGDVRGGGDSNFKQWSATFWRELLREFEAHEDLEGLSVFFDSSDRPDEGVKLFAELDPLLKEKASKAAILLPLVSPRYLRSTYCLQELAWWREAEAGRPFDQRGRLAPVVIWGVPPTGTTSWKEALTPHGMGNLMWVDFYARDKAQMRPQPFGWPGGGDRVRDMNFYDPLLEVVGILKQRLFELRDEIRTVGPEPPPSASSAKPNIYLHGRDDAPDLWDEAADALTAAGFPVSPDGPEPVRADAAARDDIREARIGAMSTCDALLVIGPQDGNVFRQELMILGSSDRRAAIDRAEQLGKPGKRLPWAVVDPIQDPALAKRRKAWAENNRLNWFEFTDPAWVNRATEWLGAAI
ncbi:MAG: hypothetical protein J0H34_01245 [Rhizobiales bacterium]|nr:hypothetical protein [Hyphomicrobiales bacterium]